MIGVGFRGSRKAVRRKAGRFNGRLRIHIERNNVQEDLKHRLWLNIIAWRAERHVQLAVFQCKGWARREPRSFARCHGGR